MSNDDTHDGHTADLIHQLTAASVQADELTDTDGRTRAAVVTLPAGWDLERLNPELWEARPYRRQGRALFVEPDSLLNYLDRFADSDAHGERPAPVYCDRVNARFVAVLDDDDQTGAGWRQHRAELQLERSEEWMALLDLNEAWHAAAEMADWLQEWRHIVADPAWSDLALLVRKFRASTKMEFRQELDDASGDVKLEYVHQTSAGGTTEIEIPEKVTFAAPVFLGSPPVKIEGLFKYRAHGGTVSFSIKLTQLLKSERDALGLVAGKISEHQGAPVLWGTPAGQAITP